GSLFKTLEEFPILAGRIKTGFDKRNYVVVDKDHLNIPDYTDTLCGLDFQIFKDADFDYSLLPENFPMESKNRVPPGVAETAMKLAEFHII
ncbi:hypothetical protein EV175_004352, partial [Coemansia sp. RSA 1933]